MPHLPRYAIITDNSYFHVTWQCHNRDWLLQHDWAKQIYYDLLLKYKDKYKITIYAYCFMSNHPHLLGHCEDKTLFSDFFRIVNSQFAKTYNLKMNRRGQVVMDRFKSPRIDSEKYLLEVLKYIELNPVRARIAAHPKNYRWSSFLYYAFGKSDPLITPAPCYIWLGKNDQERRKEYLKIINHVIDSEIIEKKNYSSIYFIGNPAWVITKKKELKNVIKNKKQKIFINTDPPPN